jgi:hypothetical protein
MLIFTTNGIVPLPGLLTMMCGVVAGILALDALIADHERSWLLWLMLLPGLFAILLFLAQVLLP